MYAKYFGFDKLPFNVGLQTDTFIYGGKVRSVGNRLIKAICDGHRVVALTGASGIGKTSLMAHVEIGLSCGECEFVFLDRVSSRDQFINTLCAGLDFELRGVSAGEKLQGFNAAFLHRQSTADHVVVVLDNAHNMAPEILRDCLLVATHLGNESTFVQLVLIGLPAVRDMTQPETVYWCFLEGMSIDETAAYIDQRLHFVGYNGRPLFSPDAIERLTYLTQGNPGLTNVLCGFALLHISLENLHVVDLEIIDIVADHCMLQGEQHSDESLQSENLRCQVDLTEEKVTGLLTIDKGAEACSSLSDRYVELGIPVPNTRVAQNAVGSKKMPLKITYLASCVSVLIVLSGVLFANSSRFGLLPWFVSNVVEVHQGDVYSYEFSRARKDSGRVFLALKDSQATVTSELQAMLLVAEKQIVAHRLVAPLGDNALETYQGILNIGREQLEVLNKLAALSQFYQAGAIDAEAQAQWGKAEEYYARALDLSPYDEELGAALQRVRIRNSTEGPDPTQPFSTDLDA